MENHVNTPNNKVYIIKLQGRLSETWADWFGEMEFTHESDGTTTLTGEVVDQTTICNDMWNALIALVGLGVVAIGPARSALKRDSRDQPRHERFR